MKRRIRKRRILKWMGVGMCAVTVIAWVTNWGWYIIVLSLSGDFFWLRGGCVEIVMEGSWQIRPLILSDAILWPQRIPGLSGGVFVPLWILVASGAIPTGLLPITSKCRINPPSESFWVTGTHSLACYV